MIKCTAVIILLLIVFSFSAGAIWANEEIRKSDRENDTELDEDKQ